MKNLFIIVLLLFLCGNYSFARDYTKLHKKEMNHAQKYGASNKYFEYSQADSKETKNKKKNNVEIKDPKILFSDSFPAINKAEYEKKIKADEVEYEKIAKAQGLNNTKLVNTSRTRNESYYKLYRIAEKMIRANNLDFINWRIGVYNNADNANAYNTNMNYVAISSSMYDTFNNNDDALAMVIGHEMSHALLGHLIRHDKLINDIKKSKPVNNSVVYSAAYDIYVKKYQIESKNMEYTADVEGAKLAATAGYDLDKGVEVLSYFNTFTDSTSDYYENHPTPKRRLENFRQNRKYFIEDDWKKKGEYNIYNSEVLPLAVSSDRKSFVINASSDKPKSDYYKPETKEDISLRFAYKSYLNREFSEALKYFNEYFKLNDKNAAAYLYASYTSEQLYNEKNSGKYLEEARKYIEKAYSIKPENQYIKEQYNELIK